MIGCDLGSNTLRIVQIDCKSKKRLKSFERIVKTGENLQKTGYISEESIQNILIALKDASKFIDFKSDKVKCIATQALRVAKNADSIIETIQKMFGLKFEIIDGETEARYTIVGVKASLERLKIKNDNFAIFDLGGGSTELSFVNHKEIETRSFAFGILNVFERYKEDLEAGVEKELKPLVSFAKRYKKPPFLVATAGTPTTVCAFLHGLDYGHYDYEVVNGKALHVEDFKKAYDLILSMSKKEQERYCGVGRSELIKTGINIVVNLMQKIGFDECIVIDDGLREGVALSLC
jgi:exopolyphosphatase/guanosine-5'-triphosphate,3'-diphosphate pyrophosphatase